MTDIDFQNPDYAAIFKRRVERLNRIRQNPDSLPALKAYYRENPADFIEDWGLTFDPRNVEKDQPATVPFILFDRQREFVNWVVEHWREQKGGIAEKTRDMGLSWLSVAIACTLCLFNDGVVVGFGSRKEEYVDRIGSPKSLFWKARMFMEGIPKEFRADWTRKDAPHMRINFPGTGSSISGEAGDGIGRGDRTSIYFVDEAQPLDAVILTPGGWRQMGAMSVGDRVIGSSGQAVTVLGVNNAVQAKVYEFIFSDGTTARCSPNHLWTVSSVIGKRHVKTARAKDIAEDYVYRSPGGQTQYRYRLPTCDPVDFGRRGALPVDPYVLGALLGDGSLSKSSVMVTSADPEIVDHIRGRLPEGYTIEKCNDRYDYRIAHRTGRGSGRDGNHRPLWKALIDLGLKGRRSWEKHIPESYLMASQEDRLEVLRGLMDTDGSASGGKCTFHTASKELADGVAFIVRSLGGMATQKVKPDNRGYRDQHCVYVALPDGVSPFRLERKTAMVPSRKYEFCKSIVDVKVLPEETVQCIQVDSDDGLYVTDGFAVTHNSAFLERPQLVEASLSQTTNCRIDISTPHGMGNPFAEKRHSGKYDVFTFHWRDDPRKDEAWYEQMQRDLDAVTVAQEIDINYQASVEGILIPSEWVQAAIGAHKKLGIEPTGARKGALDVADEGKDLNAFLVSQGVVIKDIDSWSGKGSDIYGTVEKAFRLCDENKLEGFDYDADGLGAGVRGDARVINDRRKAAREKQINVTQFRGSAGVTRPEQEAVQGRKNKDFFLNAKAQAWWYLRLRFQATYRAVVEGMDFKPDDIISVSEDIPAERRNALVSELTQPTYDFNAAGKMFIEKAPEATRSPNMADAVMIRYAPKSEAPPLSSWV